MMIFSAKWICGIPFLWNNQVIPFLGTCNSNISHQRFFFEVGSLLGFRVASFQRYLWIPMVASSWFIHWNHMALAKETLWVLQKMWKSCCFSHALFPRFAVEKFGRRDVFPHPGIIYALKPASVDLSKRSPTQTYPPKKSRTNSEISHPHKHDQHFLGKISPQKSGGCDLNTRRVSGFPSWLSFSYRNDQMASMGLVYLSDMKTNGPLGRWW